MENERPIEKLLRRYAKKRNEERGADPELHPATRRLLQGEVARQFKNTRDAKTGSFRWLPQLITAFTVLILAAVVTVFVLQRSGRGSGSVEMAGLPKQSQSLESDAAKKTERLDAYDDSSRGVIARDARAVHQPEAVDSLAIETPATPTPARKEIMPETATAKAYALDTAREEPVVNTGTLSLSLQPAGAPTPASAAVPIADGSNFGGLSRATVAQTEAVQFSNGTPPPRGVVLAAFQVEQSGNELRVKDSDGSTYAGTWRPASIESEAEKSRLRQKANENALVRRTQNDTGLFDAAGAFVQNSYFRVAGTNKTLNQQVVFTGNILSVTNAVWDSQAREFRQVQNIPFPQNYNSLLNNSIIVGRAQVEQAKEIEVNASPSNQ